MIRPFFLYTFETKMQMVTPLHYYLSHAKHVSLYINEMTKH